MIDDREMELQHCHSRSSDSNCVVVLFEDDSVCESYRDVYNTIEENNPRVSVGYEFLDVSF